MDYNIIYHEIGKDPMFKIWHASPMSMFLYINSEGGSIVCSEKAYPIQKGVLCFIGAGKYHYTMPQYPEAYDRSKLFVSTELMDKILNILPDNIMLQNFSGRSFVYALIDDSEKEKVENIFCKLKECENDEVYGEWEIVSAIIELLVILKKYSLENTPDSSGLISKAIEYINSNIMKNLTIDEICKKAHLSKFHFCRLFKNTTGRTVMEYVLETRIVMAKNMLLNEKLSVTEISNRCGFSSISYFSRVFKEKTGVTPLDYKKQKNH